MRPEKAKRVELNPAQSGLAGLGNALTGLNLGPLPPAPPGSVKDVPAAPAKAKRMGRVILRRETAHRGGKTVIVVHDFPTSLPVSEIEKLAKGLRRALGTGGAAKARTIEMQGDQAAKIREFLEGVGYEVAGV